MERNAVPVYNYEVKCRMGCDIDKFGRLYRGSLDEPTHSGFE